MLCARDSLTEVFKDSMVSHAIFTDFAKSFDQAAQILLYKLELYAISG